MSAKARQKRGQRKGKQNKDPRRVSETVSKTGPLTLDEVTCKICLSIFEEPVTLPCAHNVCLTCFNKFIRETTLNCPYCRFRLSSWSRKAFNENSLVNADFQDRIREQFADALAAQKQNDGDAEAGILPKPEESETENVEPFCRDGIAVEPGELKKDLESIYVQHQRDMDEMHKEEELASQAIINQLLEEQERIRQEEELKAKQLEEDFNLARKLQEEAAVPIPTPTPKHPIIISRKSFGLKAKAGGLSRRSNVNGATKRVKSLNSNSFLTPPSQKRPRPSTSVSPAGDKQTNIMTFFSSPSQSRITSPESSQKSSQQSSQFATFFFQSQATLASSSPQSQATVTSLTQSQLTSPLSSGRNRSMSSSTESRTPMRSKSPQPCSSKSLDENFSRQYSSSPITPASRLLSFLTPIPKTDSQDDEDSDFDTPPRASSPALLIESEEEDQEHILNAILSQRQQAEEDLKLALLLQGQP